MKSTTWEVEARVTMTIEGPKPMTQEEAERSVHHALLEAVVDALDEGADIQIESIKPLAAPGQPS
jgi:hypothetical protein